MLGTWVPAICVYIEIEIRFDARRLNPVFPPAFIGGIISGSGAD